MIPDKVLTVDTGLTTAWAFWNGTVFPQVDYFTCPKNLNQIDRIKYMLTCFEAKIALLSPVKIILEMVEFWEGSDKSRMATVRGDTFTLALLIGAYVAKAIEYKINVELLTAREWKGQLSKEATAWRVAHINGQFYINEHITDAVAMGLSRDEEIWHLKKLYLNG